MNTMRAAIEHTVPISSFNRGLAGKIFGDVKKTGAKVVMKNNVAECVLLSPQAYISLMDELNDARLLALAVERTKGFDPALAFPQDQVDRAFGFRAEDLSDVDEAVFE